MARKLPSRVEFYRSPPHAGMLLANLSSCKSRTVCGGDNALGCDLDVVQMLIAVTENTNHLRGVIFRKSNGVKNM